MTAAQWIGMLVTMEAEIERLRAHVYESLEGIDRTLSVLVRRLEALEAWRLEAESQLAQGVCSGEDCGAIQLDEDDVRWLPGSNVALPGPKGGTLSQGGQEPVR